MTAKKYARPKYERNRERVAKAFGEEFAAAVDEVAGMPKSSQALADASAELLENAVQLNIDLQVVDDPAAHDPPAPCRVMGIDPGFAHIGVMLIDFSSEGLRCVHREKIETGTDDGDNHERLDIVARRLHGLFAQWVPDVIAYENVVSVGFGTGDRNAASSRMYEVIGMIRMCGQLFAARPVYAITTATARAAVFGKGHGRGRSKAEVRDEVARLLGIGRINLDIGEAGAVCFGGFARHHSTIHPPAKPVRKPRSKDGQDKPSRKPRAAHGDRAATASQPPPAEPAGETSRVGAPTYGEFFPGDS